MKNSRLVKVVLVMMISLIMILGVNIEKSFAANSINITDLTNTVVDNNTTNTTNTTTTVNNTTSDNTTNNTVLKTNNSSNYNNTTLPKTGVEDTMPAIIVGLVFGISAIYAYKKMKYYKNV